MKSLLIAGGTGFFGKSFISAFEAGLLAKWGIQQLIIAARHASQFAQNTQARRTPNVFYIDLDFSQHCELPDCDYIMHFAGSSDTAAYQKNLNKEIHNLEQNMLSFVKSIERSPAKPQNILFVSSGAVYGPTSDNFFSETASLNQERQFACSKQHYARAKLFSERTFCRLNKKNRKLSIARAFSFVGPSLPLNSHFVAGNLIRNILMQEPLHVSAFHSVKRSYLHTDDLIVWLAFLTMMPSAVTAPVSISSFAFWRLCAKCFSTSNISARILKRTHIIILARQTSKGARTPFIPL